mmetsp:Transcript_4009/g.6151  ORF Transcript_4009/g.6151 Transcript_4009/m.6151 type:complete len:362 (+) Transcript_4009:99-1184(+)|eukprot:CAMPEP_0194254322 /NCGR_PEP_ID=MMETSP0158-20130606/31867_1 /TAXON_ID=33649 /ORGANISM="Thalassionema nitzschioides, Strain L26-B" /LENGTH=361 /DNA_ID=CAMNT_0038992303 /DNA_START=14 /DNA_END=1099 /DNA_ORIENTATION=-
MTSISKPKSKGWEEVSINRVCFRSDDRAPYDSYYNKHQQRVSKWKTQKVQPDAMEIFKTGFTIREGYDKPEYRSKSPLTEVGDIQPETAVCVSQDFFATPFFPLTGNFDVKGKEGWTYAVFVEKGYNTKCKQVFHAQTIQKQKTKVGLRKSARLALTGKDKPTLSQEEAAVINWALFGEELAVPCEIPVRNIIAAVRITNRAVVGGDAFKNGVSFTASQLVRNPNFAPASLSEEMRKKYFSMTVDFLRGEIDNPSRTVTPNQTSGFTKNEPSTQAQAQSFDVGGYISSWGHEPSSRLSKPKPTRTVHVIKSDLTNVRNKIEGLECKKDELEKELEDTTITTKTKTRSRRKARQEAEEVYWT